MANQNPSLRFDHREIAVIFSLFIFVSLLMFTVGILVGKGLAQAKYESLLLSPDHPKSGRGLSSANPDSPPPASAEAENPKTPSAENQKSSIPAGPEASSNAGPSAANTVAIEEKKKPAPPVQLIPQHAKNPESSGLTLQEPASSKEAEHVLKDPKIRALLDEPSSAPKRNTASAPRNPSATTKPGTPPSSFSKGLFTVQVGSYPTQKDAAERVQALKKLGFPYAYFSAKELVDSKDTWYRVGLGYYPDKTSAETSGAFLQKQGEVKNYLVRKTDARD